MMLKLIISLSLFITGLYAKDAKMDNLIHAVETNNLELVKKLSTNKTLLEEKDARQRTPLLIATQKNLISIAKVLIEAGANVNAQDEIQDSPLLYAGAEGRLDILKMILKSNPNFKIYNRYGGSALIPAAERGHVEVVKELLKTSIDINHINKLGWTALMEAVVLGDGGPKHQEIISLLVAAGADINIPDRDGVSAYTHAKNRGYKKIMEILAKK